MSSPALRFSAILIAFGFLFPTISTPLAQAQLSVPGCDVSAGQRIQDAVDRASEGGRIVVCAGIYAESVRIWKNGLTLDGKEGAILEGPSLAGPQYGIQIEDGVQGFTLQGFEIREFAKLTLGDDPSSGVVAWGRATGVTLRNNYIHDNAWTGVLAGSGLIEGWTLENNRFETHGFAHLFLMDAKDLRLAGNTLGSAPYGVILSNVTESDIANNLLRGSGRAAIVVLPSLYDPSGWSDDVRVTGNTIRRAAVGTSAWEHGLWAAGLRAAVIEGNTITSSPAAMTLGGNPEGIRLDANGASPLVETKDIREVLVALGYPTTPTGGATPAGGALGFPLEDPLSGLVGSRTTEIPPILCGVQGGCSTTMLLNLLDYVVRVALNPVADPTVGEDLARLNRCAGQGDACLRMEFFHAPQEAPNSWSLDLAPDPQLGQVRLQFIDAGTKRAGEAKAYRERHSALEADWTVQVLCRLYVGTTPHSCAAAPRLFDYGLDINFPAGDRDQHASFWHLKLPSDAVHSTFNRVHGQDASLFYATSKPHHGESPPPVDAETLLTTSPVPTDPKRTVYAGTALLRCNIGLSARDATSGELPLLNTCPPFSLLKEQIKSSVYWCPGPRAAHEEDIHDRLVEEVVALWPWSRTCLSPSGTPALEWSTLFSTQDLEDLASAHTAYYQAPPGEETAQTGALADAEAVFERAASRHIALGVPGHGMPTAFNQSLLTAQAPTVVSYSPGQSAAHTSALWAGSAAYLFGGTGGQDNPRNPTAEIRRYTPATNTLQSVGSLPTARWHTAAVWTGTHAYVFGGLDVDPVTRTPRPLRDVIRFDPATPGASVALPLLPEPLWGTAAVWDGRDRPLDGCGGGCAYLFGGKRTSGLSSQILKFNPHTGTLTPMLATLPTARSEIAAVWTGEKAYLFGGADPNARSAILVYDPLTDTLTTHASRLPVALTEASVAWDGERVHLFGGRNGGTYFKEIVQFDPATGQVFQGAYPLPSARAATSAVWAGTHAFVFGGASPSRVSEIVKVSPVANVGLLTQALLPSASNFAVVDLTGGTGPSGNLDLLRAEVPDGTRGWMEVNATSLVAFTPVRLTYQLVYPALNGDLLVANFSLLAADTPATFTGEPLAVAYGDKLALSLIAEDPDNRDHLAGYTDVHTKRTHTLLLVAASEFGTVGQSTSGTLLGEGLHAAGFSVPLNTTTLKACIQEVWTAQAGGSASNLVPDTLLAASDQGHPSRCTQYLLPPALNLTARVPGTIALELREGASGDQPEVSIHVVDDPYRPLPNTLDPQAAHDLAAVEGLPPVPLDARAVEPISVRVIVRLPTASTSPTAAWTRHTQALALAELLEAFQGQIGVFAVEIDDLPLPPELSDVLEESILKKGTVVLVGAGRIPLALRTWAPHEKLMTITGLAAHPLVLTVGALGPNGRTASWTRLGPTTALTPKPDFLAPSPEGTTGGAVANLLPFVEAVTLRGLRDANLVRAVLAAYAVPVLSEAGTPATYWEQGSGAVDLGMFLELPPTPDILDAYAARNGLTPTAARQALGAALGTAPGNLDAQPPTALLGVAASPTSLIRSTVSATLLNITLDSPALPGSLVVDFGLVNYEREGQAEFRPIDLDSVLDAALRSTRLLLQEAGYTGTDLDTAYNNLVAAVQARAAAGQQVTINTTHYRLFELLSSDFLFTGYDRLLRAAQSDAPALLTPPVSASLAQVEATLQDWLLTPHHLVEEVSTTARIDATVELDCEAIPVAGTLQLADTVLAILKAEAVLLSGTIKENPATNTLEGLPEDALQFVGQDNRDYLQSQGEQLMCLQDQQDILSYLKDRVEALRAVKQAPWGAWNATEWAEGKWNQTPLGVQLNATMQQEGRSAQHLARNATVVLDITLDAIARSLALLNNKMRLVGTPNVTAVYPEEGLQVLRTLPSRTSTARLGPYVGITTLTSHGVTLYNPVTGEPVAKRNITFPVPSLLWNNPTLTWNESWRDGTPYPDAFISLSSGAGPVFDKVKVNATKVVDGVIVALGVNWTKLLGEEIALLNAHAGLLQQHMAAVNASANLLGIYTDRHGEIALATQHGLNQWIAAAACSRTATCPIGTNLKDKPMGVYWSSALDATLTSLYSHMPYQAGITDETGRVRFPNLFSGAVSLHAPYPFAMLSKLDLQYPYAMPGKGVLEGPMEDLDYSVNRLARDTVNRLQAHDTAAPPGPEPNPVSYPVGVAVDGASFDWFPMFEVQSYGTNVSQFNLSLQGADLLGVGCLAAREWTREAGVPMSYPGCGTPVIPQEVQRELEHTLQFARCILGKRHQPLSPPDESACTLLRDATTAPAGTAEAALYGPFLEATENLTAALEDVLQVRASAPVPWPRSPARLLATRNSSYDFTTEGLLPATKALNPNKDNDTIRSAIQTALNTLKAIAENSFNVEDPPYEAEHNHTLAQGNMHHVTDRVSGLDWFHFGTAPPQEIESAQVVKDAVSDAVTLMAQDSDEFKLLDNLTRVYAEVGDLDALRDYNRWLQAKPTDIGSFYTAGWAPNGTLAPGGLNINGVLSTKTLAAAHVCHGAAGASGLVGSYLPCRDLSASVTPTEIVKEGHVDRVQFANTLLEEARASSHFIDRSAEGVDLVRRIVNKSVALASAPPIMTVRRSEDAFLINSSTEAAVPAVGLLMYSTPIPMQETLQYRLDGEILLENTGAIVISTASPTITRGVINSLSALDVKNLSLNKTGASLLAPERVITHIEKVLNGVVDDAYHAGEPLLRVEILGLPLGVEQSFEHRPLQGFRPLDATPDTGNAVRPRCEFGSLGEFRICSKGFVTVRQDGFYNYSRTHTFNTRLRGLEFGEEALNVLILYFPLYTQGANASNLSLAQKVMVKNFTIQMNTFLGLKAEGSEACKCFNVTAPIRYRPNVEEWRLFYAIPQGPLAASSGGIMSEPGVHVSFSSSVATIRPTQAKLVKALPVYGEGSCDYDAVTGYRTTSFLAHVRSPARDGDLVYKDQAQECRINYVEGLQARHSYNPKPTPMAGMGQTRKYFADALQYVYHVADREQFAPNSNVTGGPRYSSMGASLALFDQYNGAPNTGLVNPGALVSAVRGQLAASIGVAFEELDAAATASGKSLLNLSGVLPFVQPSFIPGAQGELVIPLKNNPLPLHHWVVLNETDAKQLMGNSWDPRLPVTRQDQTAPPSAKLQAELPLFTHGQRLPLRLDDPEHRAGVAAHAFAMTVQQASGLAPPPTGGTGSSAVPQSSPESFQMTVVKQAETLVGHGISGTGVALRAQVQDSVLVTDTNTESFLQSGDFSSGAVATLELFVLDGDRTARSDCSEIPRYLDVSGYYLCTGYEHRGITTGAAASFNPGGCYDDTLAFVAASQASVLAQQGRLRAWPYFGTAALDEAISRILPVPTVPASNDDRPSARTLVTLAWSDLNATQERVEATEALLRCLARSGSVALGLTAAELLALAQGTTAYTRALENATTKGRSPAVADHLRDIIKHIQPAQYLHGEPARRVESALGLTVRPSPVGFLNHEGLLKVPYALEEWSSEVSEAALHLKETNPAGVVVSSTTLASTPYVATGTPMVKVGDLPFTLSSTAAVWTGSKAYLFGGNKGSGFSNQIVVYDPATQTFSLSPTQFSQAFVDSVAVWAGNKAYVFGGRTTSGLRQAVEVFDPATGTLTSGGNLLVPAAEQSAVWTGGAVYLFGGFNAAGATNTIYRYDPATKQTTLLPAKLPSPRYSTSAVWDGTHAYILGGWDGTKNFAEIVRFTPATGAVTILGVSLPTPLRAAAATWTGSEAYLFGGFPWSNQIVRFQPAASRADIMNATLPTGREIRAAVWMGGTALVPGGFSNGQILKEAFRYDPAQDHLWERRLHVGSPGGYVTLELKHGNRYDLNLSGVDNYGNAFGEQVTVTSDVVLPEILAMPALFQATNQDLTLAWTLRDELSGLHTARLEERNPNTGTWEERASLLPTAMRGTTLSTPVTWAFSLAGRVHGQEVNLRLVMEDQAGNIVVSGHRVLVDLVAPQVNAAILNAVGAGRVDLPYLNVSADAWDLTSGLASVRVWVYNHTSGEIQDLVNLTGLPGNASLARVVNWTQAWPNTQYSLNATVVDRAGNQGTFASLLVDVQVPPLLTPIVPAYAFQDMGEALRILGEVSVRGVPHAKVDRVHLRVTGESEGIRGVLFVNRTETNAQGLLAETWNAATAPNGSYMVRFELWKGRAVSYLNATVNVTKPVQQAVNLKSYQTYGVLQPPGGTTGDYDLYRVQLPPNCGTRFKVVVTAHDGHDVDLYGNKSAPENTGGDPSRYTQAQTGPGSTETIEWTNVLPTDVFTFMVRHDASAETSYGIVLDHQCTYAPKPSTLRDEIRWM
ncbi:MAG TPA: kelch repeat-containing protein [Candidatus Thermoplasmatota archaeon]|nr:kelch repeat-containing protein [Candidatus Thermoplasmatota archaeon]